MNGIVDGSCLHHLIHLLEFLAAWENRPAYLTSIVYQWCSAISEAAGKSGPSLHRRFPGRRLRYRPQNLGVDRLHLFLAEQELSRVGLDRDPVHLDATPHHTRSHRQPLTLDDYENLLFVTLEIGFRHVTPSRDQSTQYLDHTSHHKWVFETAFSSYDDEVIVDAMGVWDVDRGSLPGSRARYIAKRVEMDKPFSPELRQASIRAIEHIRLSEFGKYGLEIVRWLNHLDIDADDVVDKWALAQLLVEAICSPMGPGSLSSHCWRLLEKLVVASKLWWGLTSRDTEVMRSLEKDEDWEKLGVWMVVVWSSLPSTSITVSESMEDVEEVTLKSLLRRPSALQGFEDLCETGILSRPGRQAHKDKLQRICDQARAEQSPSESSLSP